MKGREKIIAGMVLGAGAMYLLDPDRGGRRRSLLRDQGVHISHKVGAGLAAKARHTGNRTLGAAAELRSRLRHAEKTEEALQALMQDSWAPGLRLAVGGLGGLLALKGVRHRSPAESALGLLGLGLLTRAITKRPVRRPLGLGSEHPAFEFHETIHVAVPVEQVWQLWSNFENFPRFMTRLREVRKIDEGRSHWVARGPAGIPIEWDAVITDWVPEHLIGWKSVEGSALDTVGRVTFRPFAERTEIDVDLSYRPSAGALENEMDSLFAGDPKRAIDDDLGRLKALLEAEFSAEGKGIRLEHKKAASKPRPRKAGGKGKNSPRSDTDG